MLIADCIYLCYARAQKEEALKFRMSKESEVGEMEKVLIILLPKSDCLLNISTILICLEQLFWRMGAFFKL